MPPRSLAQAPRTLRSQHAAVMHGTHCMAAPGPPVHLLGRPWPPAVAAAAAPVAAAGHDAAGRPRRQLRAAKAHSACRAPAASGRPSYIPASHTGRWTTASRCTPCFWADLTALPLAVSVTARRTCPSANTALECAAAQQQGSGSAAGQATARQGHALGQQV
jgi:hypothetical protein